MKRITVNLIGLAMLILSSVSASAVSGTPWTDLVEKLTIKGELNQTIMGETHSFSREIQQDDKTIKEYISILGRKDAQGRFKMEKASLVSEVWSKPSANRIKIEQVLRQVDLDGDIVGSNRRVMLIDAESRQLLSAENLASLPPEEEVSQFLQIMQEWYKYAEGIL